MTQQLSNAGISAEAIHGNKSQGARQRALKNFSTNKTRVLVATDIAARGIDVDRVSHVINFELPNIAEDYIHRIGRTARAGATGIAISMCDPSEQPYLRAIEKLIMQQLEVSGGEPSRHEPANSNQRRQQKPKGRSRSRHHRAQTKRRVA